MQRQAPRLVLPTHAHVRLVPAPQVPTAPRMVKQAAPNVMPDSLSITSSASRMSASVVLPLNQTQVSPPTPSFAALTVAISVLSVGKDGRWR